MRLLCKHESNKKAYFFIPILLILGQFSRKFQRIIFNFNLWVLTVILNHLPNNEYKHTKLEATTTVIRFRTLYRPYILKVNMYLHSKHWFKPIKLKDFSIQVSFNYWHKEKPTLRSTDLSFRSVFCMDYA